MFSNAVIYKDKNSFGLTNIFQERRLLENGDSSQRQLGRVRIKNRTITNLHSVDGWSKECGSAAGAAEGRQGGGAGDGTGHFTSGLTPFVDVPNGCYAHQRTVRAADLNYGTHCMCNSHKSASKRDAVTNWKYIYFTTTWWKTEH